MKRIVIAVFAIGLALAGDVALAEVPLTATVVNCEINVQGTNLPVNALVDLTVIGGGGSPPGIGPGLRFTEKIRTTASGTATATVRLAPLFPGKNINGRWGVSMDIGITSVMVAGCPTVLPNTSTNGRTSEWPLWALVLAAAGAMAGASLGWRAWTAPGGRTKH